MHLRLSVDIAELPRPFVDKSPYLESYYYGPESAECPAQIYSVVAVAGWDSTLAAATHAVTSVAASAVAAAVAAVAAVSAAECAAPTPAAEKLQASSSHDAGDIELIYAEISETVYSKSTRSLLLQELLLF